VRGGRATLTDGRRRPSPLSTLVAIDDDGRVAWDTELDLLVARDGVVVDAEVALVVGIAPGHGASLVEIQLADGTVRGGGAAPSGGSGPRRLGTPTWIRNQSAAVKRPGLYRLAAEGDGDVIVEGACWMAATPRDRLVTLAYISPAGQVAVRQVGDCSVAWSASVVGAAGDADSLHVVTLERVGARDLLTLRELATGDVCWRAELRTAEVIDTIAIAGAVVAVASLDGWAFFRRADGTWLGRSEAAIAPPAAVGNLLLVGGRGFVLCADLTNV